MVTLAEPTLSVPVPSGMEPSRNVTVPVAVEGTTVARRAMLCPTLEGLALDEMLVVVTAGFTV